MEHRIRVAIIGGGLTGATLANALIPLSHLEINVYESAASFSERGASVGLSANAKLALQEIVPSVPEFLERAGGVQKNSSRIVIGSGTTAGTLVIDLGGGDPGVSVHRASLLRELLAPLPQEVLHANKTATSIIQAHNGTIEITFQDGVVDYFDAVIGADGIFSTVRSYVLSDITDQWCASPAGFWDCRVLVPFEKARDTIGAEYIDNNHDYMWIGDGATILHGAVENRTMVQCIISFVEKDPPTDRRRPLDRDYLTQALQSWMDGPIANGIIDLILEQPNPHGYSLWDHKTTPTFASRRVCIAGDAAHASTPWQGAGVGQAFEDVIILKTLLETITSREDIEAAFIAYDAVRRPRCQQIIDSSRGTGQILCGQIDAVGQDPAKLREALGSRWNFIFSVDLAKYKQEALDKFNEIQAGNRRV